MLYIIILIFLTISLIWEMGKEEELSLAVKTAEDNVCHTKNMTPQNWGVTSCPNPVVTVDRWRKNNDQQLKKANFKYAMYATLYILNLILILATVLKLVSTYAA